MHQVYGAAVAMLFPETGPDVSQGDSRNHHHFRLCYFHYHHHAFNISSATLLACSFGDMWLHVLVSVIRTSIVLFSIPSSQELFGRLFFYWLQHILIFFVVPPYLIYLWGEAKHTTHGTHTQMHGERRHTCIHTDRQTRTVVLAHRHIHTDTCVHTQTHRRTYMVQLCSYSVNIRTYHACIMLSSLAN